jgi:glucokinase
VTRRDPTDCSAVPAVLAVDLGGTGVKAEVVAADLTVLAAGRRPTPRGGGDAVLAEVVDLGRELLDGLPVSRRPQRVGLAVPGVVDAVAGIGRMSVNLGWRDAPVARTVGAGLGLPVVLAHDVTVAGLAEHRIGAGRGVDDLVVVVVGTGVAAAVVAAGRPLTGGLGQAGELGHVVVRPGGPACGCGRRGCVEAVASAASIARRYTELSGTPVGGALAVRQRLGSDPVADAVWAEAVDGLADGLLTALALLGPSRVVVGGGLADAGEALLTPLRAALAARATVEHVPEVVPAALGARAGLVGAALAAQDPAALHAVVHQP